MQRSPICSNCIIMKVIIDRYTTSFNSGVIYYYTVGISAIVASIHEALTSLNNEEVSSVINNTHVICIYILINFIRTAQIFTPVSTSPPLLL